MLENHKQIVCQSLFQPKWVGYLLDYLPKNLMIHQMNEFSFFLFEWISKKIRLVFHRLCALFSLFYHYCSDAVKLNLSNSIHSSEINGIVNVIRLLFFSGSRWIVPIFKWTLCNCRATERRNRKGTESTDDLVHINKGHCCWMRFEKPAPKSQERKAKQTKITEQENVCHERIAKQ